MGQNQDISRYMYDNDILCIRYPTPDMRPLLEGRIFNRGNTVI